MPSRKPSLAETNPELAAQAHGWDPAEIGPGSKQKLVWKCKYGHEWMSSVKNRVYLERGCPFCAGQQVLVGFNDLATTNPELATQADGWDPRTTTSGSGKRVPWKCQLGHKWKAIIKSRKYGAGCPVCAGRSVLVGFNDLATTHPKLAEQADGWDPRTTTSGSGKRVPWKCQLDHRWISSIGGRTRGRGCPYCAGQKVLAGFNDLATTHPKLAEQADGWDPTIFVSMSKKRAKWKCKEGHTWETKISHRSRGSDCPVCANQVLLVGFNDLATTHPELATEADGWDPTTVISGTNQKLKWKCSQGHSWKALASNRCGLGHGCPSCAKSGFDPNIPGWLYLIDHDGLAMYQIGISNFPKDRLAAHESRGWEVIELRGPMDGHLIQKLETDCLHSLDKRGAILGHKAGIEKFDGYSEAWSKHSLYVSSIKQILDWVYEDEAK